MLLSPNRKEAKKTLPFQNKSKSLILNAKSNAMSFKLVDNKGSSDNRLHSRKRAEELMLDFIPSTEYIVNRSGKYCCKVCPQWPVFDTPVMLKRHRESGKHGKNRDELERVLLQKALASPANECSIVPVSGLDSKVLLNGIKTNAAACISPEGERLGEPCTRSAPTVDAVNHSGTKRKRWTPFFQTRHEVSSKEATVNMLRSLDTGAGTGNSKLADIEETKSDRSNRLDSRKRKKQNTGKSFVKRTLTCSSKEQVNLTTDNMDLKMKYYAKMKQSGWILDSEGKWTKDEECEFDSDEEPPKFSELEKWNK